MFNHTATQSARDRVLSEIQDGSVNQNHATATAEKQERISNSNFWDFVKKPMDGSLLESMLSKDFNFEKWFKEKGMDEFSTAFFAAEVPVTCFLLHRLVMPYSEAIDVATRLSQAYEGKTEYEIVSDVTNRKIVKKADFLKLVKSIVAYHPSVANKLRNMVMGTKFAQVL
jgi:hypothetical protein